MKDDVKIKITVEGLEAKKALQSFQKVTTQTFSDFEKFLSPITKLKNVAGILKFKFLQ